MNKWLIASFALFFSLGFVLASLTNEFVRYPVSFDSITKRIAQEKLSPSDHITKDKIHVYEDKIIINISNAIWSEFADTNSMDPLLDVTANGIEIRPKSAEQISVGDIISYKSDKLGGVVIHRVIEKGEDEKGTYFVVKGDNNPVSDPEKVRFDQVQGILVGVIY